MVPEVCRDLEGDRHDPRGPVSEDGKVGSVDLTLDIQSLKGQLALREQLNSNRERQTVRDVSLGPLVDNSEAKVRKACSSSGF